MHCACKTSTRASCTGCQGHGEVTRSLQSSSFLWSAASRLLWLCASRAAQSLAAQPAKSRCDGARSPRQPWGIPRPRVAGPEPPLGRGRVLGVPAEVEASIAYRCLQFAGAGPPRCALMVAAVAAVPSGWHQRLLERTTTSCHRRSLQPEARQGSAAQPSIGCQTDSDRAATTLLRQRCRVWQHSRSQLGLHHNKHEGLLLRNYSAYCSYQSRLRSSFVRAHSFPLERGGKPFKAALRSPEVQSGIFKKATSSCQVAKFGADAWL